jgi:hypothetical protein
MIAVQQRVAVQNAKAGDQAINRLANSVALFPDRSEILGRRNGQLLATRVKKFEIQKLSQDPLELPIASYALQDFTEGKIRKPESPVVQLTLEPFHLRGAAPPEIIHPYGRVDNDHALTDIPPGAQLFQVAVPLHLASQPANSGLPSDVDQQS